MDAIELLEQQHRTVETLLGKLDQSKNPLPLLERIADTLAVHMEIEERVLYPAASDERTDDETQESLKEHLQIKQLVAELLTFKTVDENFTDRLKLLREAFEHHVEEEEGELFPTLRDAFEAEKLAELSEEMEALAEELEDDGSPREVLVAQVEGASPGV